MLLVHRHAPRRAMDPAEFFKRAIARLEFHAIVTLGRLVGISPVVRYLRNPNPRNTTKILRAFGATVGDRTTFKRGLTLDNSFEDANSRGDFGHLVIGANCYIGDGVYFDLANRIELGDNVVLSGQVAILTHADCNRSPLLARRFPRQCLPVRVHDGAWLGFRATVLAGVTVGREAVVAANALLREHAGPRTLYAGLPAKPIVRTGGQPA